MQRYQRACRALGRRNVGRAIKELKLYHVTTIANATSIMCEGFDVKRARLSAFGKGINLVDNRSYLSHYFDMLKDRNGRVAILTCKVCVCRAHANKSDKNTLVKAQNGGSFTKPQYMRPKPGHDAMYFDDDDGRIWVIPSSARVLPCSMEVVSGKF